MLEEGKVYKMSGGQIKMANKKFTTIKNDYQITFDERADIVEIQDQGNTIKQGQMYQFTPISELQNIIGSSTMVEVIGVITEDRGVMQIQIRSTGENKDKRTITLADESGVSVGVTFWGECGNRPEIAVGAIIAIKGAKISNYGGVSLNIDDSSSSIDINPKGMKKVESIQLWYDKMQGQGGAVKTESLTQVGEGGGV